MRAEFLLVSSHESQRSGGLNLLSERSADIAEVDAPVGAIDKVIQQNTAR
jgi:hypothetical protein